MGKAHERAPQLRARRRGDPVGAATVVRRGARRAPWPDRFFVGHGPASIKDFSRWSSSTITDTAAALREIGDGLATTKVDGTTLWFDERAPPRQTRNAFSTFLFPTYDEIVLSYPTLNFLAPGDHPNVHDPDPYWAMIIAGGWNVGT